MLTKQAKTLTPEQLATLEAHLADKPLRDTAILYLSFYAGLRACEISAITWDMVTDAAGELAPSIALANIASKGKHGGRVVPMHPKLTALLRRLTRSHRFIITSSRGNQMSPHAIAKKMKQWFDDCGLQGCSSHSGRRTFLTTAARTISLHGGSMRDVQRLAGHAWLVTTQAYVVENTEAQVSVVGSMR